MLAGPESKEETAKVQNGKHGNWTREIKVRPIQRKGAPQINVPCLIETLDDRRKWMVKGLLDSGCTGTTISKRFVREKRLTTMRTLKPVRVFNADGTENQGGPITEYVELRMVIQGHEERIMAAVTDLRTADLYLGFDWLTKHNPEVDWANHKLRFSRCSDECNYQLLATEDVDLELEDDEYQPSKGDKLLAVEMEEEIRIRAHTMPAQEFASQQNPKERTLNEIVPEAYWEFLGVFDKKDFDTLPERRQWDHAIELIPGAKAVDCKVYPLSRTEQEALDEFLNENL